MSADDELDKVLDDWASAVMLYQHNLDYPYPDGITPDYLNRHFAEAKKSINKLFNSKLLALKEGLPKEQEVDRDPQIGIPLGMQSAINEGFNEAIDTVTALIDGVIGEKD